MELFNNVNANANIINVKKYIFITFALVFKKDEESRNNGFKENNNVI